MTANLLITIDTEEEGLWGGQYRTTGNTVENVCAGVGRFQELCDRFQIPPTYVIDAPVVNDADCVDLLRKIQDDGRGEIGTHVHPWCNPPQDSYWDKQTSFLCNLPEKLQREKIVWLTDEIEKQFGRRPTSFRAGRYGLDIVGARILRELGYTVDSSVIPFSNWSSEGGPNFEYAPHTPYFVGDRGLCERCETGSLLEVPVSVGFNRPDFQRAQSIRNFAMLPWLRRMRSVGILDRLGIVRRIKFSPEQARAQDMKQLIDAYLAGGAPVMVMLFHSTSLVAGQSPYVKTAERLEEFFADLAEVFEYCLTQRGMVPATLSGFAEQYTQSPSMATT
ncbi:polysaccharide deacetylase family protein [Symmachiella dynata]|uniref:polysaccharide deacetylase family protein n=1 Tax=Symmachiella dynata TaxID=2527995 RepID=UPI0030EDE279